nr:hypothetical protein [Robbsia andropogonis]
MSSKTTNSLPDGKYWATRRERTTIAAANGYGQVFPQALMIVKDGWAYFERNGTRMWDCKSA